MIFAIRKTITLFISLLLVMILGLMIMKSVGAASFRLVPSSQTFERACVRTIAIEVDANGESSNAAEIELAYNPSQITILDQNPNAAGVQVETGNAYELYIYNNVDTNAGIIRVAAASFISTLSTNRTFAVIHFQSTASATNTNINIDFDGVGVTTDSNIADTATSNDILTSVTNGAYTFISGPCQSDTTPPQAVFQNPTTGSTGVNSGTPVSIQIIDDQSGVDLDSLQIIVNGVLYTINSPYVSYTGSPNSLILTFTPPEPYPLDQASTIVIVGRDLAGNTFTRQVIFNVPEPAPQTNDTTSPAVDFVSPANLATNVASNSGATIRVLDDGSGVDLTSIRIFINGQQLTAPSNAVSVTGNSSAYTFVVVPGFIRSDQINFLRVTGSDIDGNDFDRQIVFNVPAAAECPANPGEDPDDVDAGGDIPPELLELLEQLQNNPDATENVVTNCYGQDIQSREVPRIVNEIIKSENIFKGTPFERTIVNNIVQETGAGGFAALITVFLVSLNAIPLGSLVVGSPSLFLRLMGIIFGRDQDNPWGVITDAVTGKPIPFAICQIYAAGSQYKVSQAVSDLEGRYGFILSAGDYRLEIRQSGYKTLTRNISIREGSDDYIYDAALVPNDRTVSYEPNVMQDIYRKVLKWYRKFSRGLFIFGFVLSAITMTVSFNLINAIVFGLYLVIVSGYVIPSFRSRQRYAAVVNAFNELRVPYAQVKIYDPKTWKLVDSKVTNYNGQFDFYGEPGEYGILVAARGYNFPSNKNEYPVSKEKYGGIVMTNLTTGRNKLKMYVDPRDNEVGQSAKSDETGNVASPFSG